MPFIGFIEMHNSGMFGGWCIDKDEPEKPVSLEIYCGDVKIRTIRSENYRPDIEKRFKSPRSGFNLPIQESLRNILPKGTILTAKAPDGTVLEPVSKGNIQPIGNSDDEAKLTETLSRGLIVDKWGCVKTPFRAMSLEDRKKHAEGMAELTTLFNQRFGISLFIHYGTLLGYAREKSFIPHDDDTDLSFVIKADYIEQVADRFYDIANALKEDGHFVRVDGTGQMHVQLKGSSNKGSDIFASWHQADGVFNTYFGVSGVIYDQFTTFKDTFEGVEVNIPTNYERLLHCTYGPKWKTPDPTFQWYTPQHIVDKMSALRAIGASRAKDTNT